MGPVSPGTSVHRVGDSMYDRYGLLKVTLIVSSFYRGVLESRSLAPHFETVHIPGLVEHQSAFMAAVMGGPRSYSRGDLEEAHRHLRITDDDFDEMMRLLESTLEDFDIEPGDVDAVCNRYRELRSAIVT